MATGKRKKKCSNTDWKNPHDLDAKVAKMKDVRTHLTHLAHLAHKAEHAVDMDTEAIVAVTVRVVGVFGGIFCQRQVCVFPDAAA